MTDRQTQSESVRDTMRQREDEQHGGIISDSVKGLGRNAEVWHTRMWNCSGLVSLSPPPLPLLFSAGTDHSLQSHHSPASDSLFPLSLSHSDTYASLLTSPSLHIEVFSGWYSWSTIQFLWIIHLGWCSRANLMGFFLAGWRSWTLYSFQIKCLYCITLLRLTFTDWHTNQACCQLCEKCDSFGKSPSCSFDKFLTIHLISPLTFSPPPLQIWVRPGVWQLSRGLLWQVLPESYAWQPIHLTACLCVTGG